MIIIIDCRGDRGIILLPAFAHLFVPSKSARGWNFPHCIQKRVKRTKEVGNQKGATNMLYMRFSVKCLECHTQHGGPPDKQCDAAVQCCMAGADKQCDAAVQCCMAGADKQGDAAVQCCMAGADKQGDAAV